MNDGDALGVLHRGNRVLQAQFDLDVQLTGLLLFLPFLLPLDSLDTFYLRFQASYLFMGGDFLGAQRYVCVQFKSLMGYCGPFAQYKSTPFFDGWVDLHGLLDLRLFGRSHLHGEEDLIDWRLANRGGLDLNREVNLSGWHGLGTIGEQAPT